VAEKLFWTEGELLKRRLNDARPPVKNPGKLLDGAMDFWIKNGKRDLSLLAAEDGRMEELAGRARSFMAERMCFLDGFHSAPLDSEVTGEEEKEGYTLQHIMFTGTPPLRVPAIVLVPKGRPAPYPAVLALHDMGSLRLFGKEKLLAFEGEPAGLTEHRRKGYGGKSIMSELAERGYLVMAIDAFNFGPRTIEGAADPKGFLERRLSMSTQEMAAKSASISGHDEPFLLRNVESAGLTWPGIYTMDDIRSVDYLCGREDVIKERIGCIGMSVGGFRANHLAALDMRVKAAVSVCWTCTIEGIAGYNVGGAIGWFMLTQGLLGRMDIPDIQSLALPRAFMAMSGWDDILFQPFGIAKAHMHLRRCYEKAGCPGQLGSMVYESPHEFNAEMQKDAFEFLSVKL